MGLCAVLNLFRATFVFCGKHFSEVILKENYWLYLGYEMTRELILDLTNVFMVLQVFEYFAMVFVILTQKNRSPQQILYELQTETGKDKTLLPKQVKQNMYHLKEKRLRAIFVGIVAI
mmetsp:Transcript_8534/g.13167  ORF Transcript_8534/g.13167 Transcript_8534/m.13167 type:complete len:118 (-) Transcript_8534:706-1059(-)